MVKMIDMRSIGTLFKRAKAIIAGVVLGFQLADDLLHCQRAFNTSQAGASSLLVDTSLGKVQGTVSLVGLFFPLVDFFTVGVAVMRRLCKHFLSVLLIMLQMFCAIFSIRLFFLLIDFFTVGFSVVPVFCPYLFSMRLVVPSFLFIDFFSMCFTVLFVLHTNFFSMLLIVSFAIFSMCIVVGFRRFVSTLFATSIQPVSILVEVVSGSGKHSLTGASALLHRGILRYHIHDEGHSLSGSGRLQRRGASSCLIPHYSITPPVKQVQGVF